MKLNLDIFPLKNGEENKKLRGAMKLGRKDVFMELLSELERRKRKLPLVLKYNEFGLEVLFQKGRKEKGKKVLK